MPRSRTAGAPARNGCFQLTCRPASILRVQHAMLVTNRPSSRLNGGRGASATMTDDTGGEHLGVTKAALYYYFKSKEDIVRSLVEDYMAEMDELIEWGKAQPMSAATRAEIVRRYLGIVAGGAEVFRMLQQNQAAVASLASAKERGALFRERLDALIELLTGPGATLRDQVRAASAL